MKACFFYFSIFFFCAIIIRGQGDTVKLPFAIADEKKLSEEDIANKKTGAYVTGIPDISSDPVNGFGYGLEGELYFNGKRNDPFFAYTPYRYKLSAVLFNTTKDQRELSLVFDAPYILHSKWRLRAGTTLETNPNRLYFGVGEQTLGNLSPPDDPAKNFSKYKEYLSYLKNIRNGKPGEAAVVTDFFYNNFTQAEIVSNITMERSFFDGRVRVMLGYELGFVKITTFDGHSYGQATDSLGNQNVSAPNGETKLNIDNKAGLLHGVGTNVLGMTQLGIIYDTRDLESDPGRGIFAEVTNEWSNSAIGSVFNFSKTFFHVKGYKNIIRSKYKKLVVAARAGFLMNQGQLPFYENYDCYSSEGSIEALGGPRTLRGYKQWRFTGNFVNFFNAEVRWRLFQTDILKQHFAFGLVPFFDAGTVANNFSNLFTLSNYRYSEGLGLRIAWNVNTILRFDYAISNEDAQFFFQFGHTF